MEDAISDDGQTLKSVYYSLDEWAAAADRRAANIPNGRAMLNQERSFDWNYGVILDQAFTLAKIGWEEKLAETLAIAESAVSMVEKDHLVQVFQPVWDVAGADVDVARYLSGEPENMIDFPMAEVSKHGKVITLCASISYSCSVEAEDIERRGQVLCALALLLSRLGYASELWISFAAAGSAGKTAECKVMVKGPNDTLDPARVMFAYAHPAALRSLMFAWQNGMSASWRKYLSVPGGRGCPRSPIRDLPEGTIYLPEVRTGSGAPNAHNELKDLLRTIGLLAE